jgi:hypothetical protein
VTKQTAKVSAAKQCRQQKKWMPTRKRARLVDSRWALTWDDNTQSVTNGCVVGGSKPDDLTARTTGTFKISLWTTHENGKTSDMVWILKELKHSSVFSKIDHRLMLFLSNDSVT